jgi:hypothetical protein
MSESIRSAASAASAASRAAAPGVTPNDPKRPLFDERADGVADGLSPKQFLCLELLAAGKRVSQVVAQTGVSRKTLYRWRHEDAAFMSHLRQRRRELYDGAADRIAALLPRAVKVLTLQLSDPADPAAFRAAAAILRMTNIKELLVEDNDDEDDADGDYDGDRDGDRDDRKNDNAAAKVSAP